MDELLLELGVKLNTKDIKDQLDLIKNNKDNEIEIKVNTKKIEQDIQAIKNKINSGTPVRLPVEINKTKLNSSISEFRNKLTNSPFRIVIDVNKTKSNANIKSFLETVQKQFNNLSVNIKPNLSSGASSANNKGSNVPSIQNTPRPQPQQNTQVPTATPKQGFTGTSKITEKGIIDEFEGFKPSTEIEKVNVGLGETLTIFKQINEETGEMEESSRQYETDYKAIAEAKAKAQKEEQDSYLKTLKENSKQLEFNRQQQLKQEKEERQTQEYNAKVYTEQSNKIADLQSKAFEQNSPLTGDFRAQAESAIKAWQDGVNEIKNSSGKISSDLENKLRTLESTAKRVVAEQKQAEHGGSDLVPDDISTKVSSAFSGLDIQAEKLKQMGMYSEEVKTVFDGLRDSLSRVEDTNGFNQWKDSLKQVNEEIKIFQEEIKTATKAENLKLDSKIMTEQVENLKKKYEEIIAASPDKASDEIAQKFINIQNAIDNINPSNISTVRKNIQELRTEINGLQPQTLQQALQRLGGIGQYLARFVSATYLISKAIQGIKSMVSAVKEVDSSLLELQKVTSLTGSALDEFTDKAYKVGASLGRTGSDVIDAAATFSRAGYDLQEATELAQSALVMTNVGVDIPNTEAAASDMISILKAFDKQAEESMDVIDKLYNVANKEPLDFGNITQMLVTAGGTLAQTGTSLEETMGLLTGAYATMRDTSVANG